MNVIIPLVRSKWGEEIRYSLRSWYKNFDHQFEIHIIGDWRPDWLNTSNLHFHSIKNTGATTEENLSKVIEWCFSNFNEFIWSNDDIYLLQSVSLSDIKQQLVLQDLSKIQNRLNNRWGRLLWNTADKLNENGLSMLNGETHTPYWYESEHVKEIFKRYEIDKGRSLLRTAYINQFPDEHYNMKNYKIGFYSPADSMRRNDFNKLYLNHDDRGLTEYVKKKLFEFNEPCIFEK